MTQRFVKPAAGRQPRHEITARRIAEAGEWVNDSPYLRRRLRDGDLVEATAPQPPAKPQPKAARKAK